MRISHVLLFMLLFGTGLLLLKTEPTEQIPIPSFLPSDTLVYLEVEHGSDALATFSSSPMGEALFSLDIAKLLFDLNSPPERVLLAGYIQSKLREILNSTLLADLLGERCSVGLWPLRSWSSQAQSPGDIFRSQLVLISKPKVSSEKLEAILTHHTGAALVDTVPYGNAFIKRMRMGGDQLITSAVNGYFIISFEERIVREAIDLAEGKGMTLETRQEYAAHTSAIPKTDRLLYLSVEGLQRFAYQVASSFSGSRTEKVLTEFSAFHGVGSLVYGRWREARMFQDKILVGLKKEGMAPQVQQMLSTVASLNDTLPFIADDVLLYYWSNTLNSKLLWNMYIAEAGADSEEVRKIRNTVRTLTGLEVEKVLENISSNVAVIVKQSEREQFVPIPDIAVFIKLRETDHVAEKIKNSLNAFDINIQSRKYRQIDYHYWGIYPQESLQPAFSVYRGYLIVANSFDILKTLLDTPLGDSRLVTSAVFTELDPGFQQLNNSVCYVDQQGLLEHLRELAGWAGTMLAIQDRQAAAKSKILIDNLLAPLTAGAAMYQKSATRTYLEAGNIIIESRTHISQ